MAQSEKAKAKATQSRRRKNISRSARAGVLFLLLVVLTVATLLTRRGYLAAVEKQENPSAPTNAEEEKSTLFGVKEVTVSGNSRYLPEAILQQSGLYEGMSIWSVDKTAAEGAVLSAFPYIEAVKITNTAYNKLDIAVTETRVVGSMYADGKWVVVGANGRVLDAKEITADRPLRTLYFKGATPVSSTPGETAMEERCWRIVSELLKAFEQYGISGVCEIDLSNKSDLRLNWNNRLTVKLGGDGNLTHEIGVMASALPSIEAQYGINAAGQLDVSAFSGNSTTARAVFTPKELLPTSSTATTATSAETDENGDPVETKPED